MRWMFLFFLMPTVVMAAEFEIASAGSHPPDPEVVALVRAYVPHLVKWTTPMERDEKRKPMVAPGYFYHDMNGSFVGFDALTERHTRNDLQLIERSLYYVVLHQYENTAILTMKAWTRGTDKGKPFDGYGSAALVMTKTPAGWRAVADIVGQEPDPPQLQPQDAGQ